MPRREGGLSGGALAGQEFWDRVFDSRTRSLHLPQSGRVWDSIATARRSATGAGRCIAIIDAGFDLEAADFGQVHPASVVRPETVESSGRHGSVVALLARAVAPEVSLLLIDVAKNGVPQPVDIAEGLRLAIKEGADVINLSIEYQTDCEPRSLDWIDLDVLLSPNPSLGDYLAQIDAWIAAAEPYGDSRCRWSCEICDALATVPDRTLIVAASGNRFDATCPACFGSVMGVGFHQTTTAERAGVVLTVSGLPETPTNSFWPEFVVDEPPGFLGTSFAAPLLSGLGSLLPEPVVLSQTARLAFALTPILTLANLHTALPPTDVADGAPLTLHAGLIRFIDAMPSEHRHWEQDMITRPCPICSLVFADWYDVHTSLFLWTGQPEGALPLARIGSVVAPDLASTQANFGLACVRAANDCTDMATRDALLSEAVAAYERAVERAPAVDTYRQSLAALTSSAEAVGGYGSPSQLPGM